MFIGERFCLTQQFLIDINEDRILCFFGQARLCDLTRSGS